MRKVYTVWFVIALLVSLLSLSAIAGAEGFDWRRYQGQTITINIPNEYHYKVMVDLIPEFTSLTGVEVEIDMLQYERMHDKQILEMSKPVGDYDVIAFVCMWKTEYVAAGMLTELEPFFNDPKLAYPDYDFEDLVPVYVDVVGRVGGKKIYLGGPGSKLYAIPFSPETSILGYRKDIFDKYGLRVPETYDDVREVARILYEQVPGVYGLTMRGASGHQATAAWLFHGNPFGAKVFDENWEPAITSEESIETLYFLKDMVKYGPPGIPGFDVSAADNAFLLGKAGLYIDHDRIAGMSRDPSQSKIVGKVGWALHPKQKVRSSETGGFGLAIPSNARNKEAAFLFIQWVTSKEITKRIALAGGTPQRVSVFSDPELVNQFPEYRVLVEQIKYADPDWRPIIPEWGEINVQLMGVAVNQVLTGEKTPEEAMQGIVEPIRKIMEKAGYYKK